MLQLLSLEDMANGNHINVLSKGMGKCTQTRLLYLGRESLKKDIRGSMRHNSSSAMHFLHTFCYAQKNKF